MNRLFKDVKNLHKKFGILSTDVEYTQEERSFRSLSVSNKLMKIISSRNVEEDLDEWLDIIIYAIGSIERMGLLDVADEAFERIMQANQTRKLNLDSFKENFILELVKPYNFIEPDLSDLTHKPKKAQLSLFDFAKEKGVDYA